MLYRIRICVILYCVLGQALFYPFAMWRRNNTAKVLFSHWIKMSPYLCFQTLRTIDALLPFLSFPAELRFFFCRNNPKNFIWWLLCLFLLTLDTNIVTETFSFIKLPAWNWFPLYSISTVLTSGKFFTTSISPIH